MGTGSLIDVALRLRRRLGRLRIGPPIRHVYDPLRYAWEPHRRYLELYGEGHGRVVLIGMNPGPWGMAQTGVPFGDVVLVRDWLGITGRVGRPAGEHPRRRVEGFACARREVSGTRLWGWARDRFETPERFFQSYFVHNYCPLSFMEISGRNVTPDRLPLSARVELIGICDEALRQAIDCLAPSRIFGIGRFAELRARAAVGEAGIPVGGLLHPSPASPLANRGWERSVRTTLRRAGLPA